MLLLVKRCNDMVTRSASTYKEEGTQRGNPNPGLAPAAQPRSLHYLGRPAIVSEEVFLNAGRNRVGEVQEEG